MDLQLRIPDVSDSLDPAIETRPVYVEEWVEGLPYADPLRVFRGLYDRLREWNHAPVRPNLRLELLELLLPAYLNMVERHTQLNARPSTAAFERYRDEADAARQVAQQFAYGYKLALLEGDERRRLLRGNRHIRLATQRAALTLVYGLLHSYHQYLPNLPNLWPELHELYIFAEQQGFESDASSASGIRPEATDSIETVYARIALLSAADPLHLAYGDVWKLFTALSETPALLLLRKPGDGPAAHAAELVLSREDHAPARQAQWTRGAPDHARLVDPLPVAQYLRHKPATAERLLKQFTQALERPPRRGSERIDADGRIRVTAGLASVHHFSGGAPPAKVPDMTPAAQSSDAAEADGVIDIPDVDPDDTLPSKHLYVADSWHLANQSQAGVCLTRARRSQNLPMVGELVGLRAPQSDGTEATAGPWAVGVVRWLTIDAQGLHRIGIEVLSPNARPVHLVGPGRLKPAALVLASTNKDQIRIIAPAGTYRPSEPITVDFNGRDIILNPRELVLSSDTIECIDCVS